MSHDPDATDRPHRIPRGTRSRPALVAALVALALLIAGCGGGDDKDAETTSGGKSTSTTSGSGGGSTTDGTAPDATDGSTQGEELDVDLPRTIDYGFLSFEVTEAEQLDEHPYDAALTDPEKTYVGLTMTVTNPVEDAEYYLYPQNFSLEAGDEKSGDAFNQDNGLTAAADDETELELWFPLDKGTDLSEATFVVSEPDFEPARLPLTGDEPTTSVDVEGDPLTITNGGHKLTINGGGTIDFNQSVVEGEVGPDPEPSPTGRSPEGFAFLHLPGVGVDSSDTQFAVHQGYEFSPTYTVDGGPATGKTSWYDYVDDETRGGEFTIQIPAGAEELVITIEYTDASGAKKSVAYTVDVSPVRDLDFASQD